MVLIFEIHKDFVHERLCKFTLEIEANRNLSFCLLQFVEKFEVNYVWCFDCNLESFVCLLAKDKADVV